MTTRRTVLGSGLAWGASLLVPSAGAARPVRPGRYVEIPYGIDPAHSTPTGSVNPQRTSRAAVDGPSAAPTRQWETELGVGRPAMPAVSADGRIFVPNQAGLSAVEPDGTLGWTLRLGFVGATPSITPTSELAVGTHAGGVFVVTPLGEIRLRALVGGSVRGSPLVLPDGSIVVSAFDHATHRLDADGREMFRVAAPRATTGTVAVSDRDELWVPSGNTLQVLSMRGELLRNIVTDATVVAGPAIGADGGVWIRGEDTVLRQLAPSGAIRTETRLGVPISGHVAIAVGRDGAVRVPTRADSLVCIGAGGSERWRVDGEGSFLGGAILDASDRTFAVNQQGRLLCIDPEGQVQWAVETGSRNVISPALGPDGTLVVASSTGTLTAWR